MILEILIGLVIGFLVGLTGIGGGSLMTPSLILILGINPVVAVATDLVYMAFTKLIAIVRHHLQDNINWSLAFYFIIGSVPASITGVKVLNYFHGIPVYSTIVEQYLKLFLGIILVVVSIIFIFEIYFIKSNGENNIDLTKKIMAVIFGIIIGFIVGITSVGSGILVSLTLLLVFRLKARKIVGTDLLVAFVLVTVAGATHLFAGNVNYKLLGFLLLGSVPGVIVGSNLTNRFSDKFLKTLITILIFTGGIVLLIKNV